MRIGMTPAERAAHHPGWGVETEGIGKVAGYLNVRRSLADVYDIVIVHIGPKSEPKWRWFLKGTKSRG